MLTTYHSPHTAATHRGALAKQGAADSHIAQVAAGLVTQQSESEFLHLG